MQPLHGVLHEARLEAFCRRFGLRRDDLEANFDGWHKRVILSPDSAFLFPRYEDDVAQIEREAAALDVLADLDLVPALRGLCREPDIAPHPFLHTERRSGTSYADLEDDLTLGEIGDVLERLGAATATWHAVGTDDLPDLLRSVPEVDAVTASFLDASTLRGRLGDVLGRLASVLPDDVRPRRSWIDVWRPGLSVIFRNPADLHASRSCCSRPASRSCFSSYR
jgi:hypothetical protein